MPTFDTPTPIVAAVAAGAGSVHLIASQRTDTVVVVRPRDPSRDADVRSAEAAHVAYAHGELTVTPAKAGFLGIGIGAVDIVIELPTNSRVHAHVASADVAADGDYGDFTFASAAGRLAVQSISGTAKVSTASGDVAIDALEGDLTFQAASATLTLQRLRGRLKSRTASGSLYVGAAVSGSLDACTASGEVGMGIPAGTAARLDIVTGSGTVTNHLEHSAGPADGDQTVTVDVRTASGHVEIGRATAASPLPEH
jgi:DUF4097 and DUF4098 domain-containing protein YvlB